MRCQGDSAESSGTGSETLERVTQRSGRLAAVLHYERPFRTRAPGRMVGACRTDGWSGDGRALACPAHLREACDRRGAGGGQLWAHRARFLLARPIIEWAEPSRDLILLAAVERAADRSRSMRFTSGHPDAGRDRHVVSPAHRSPYAAADSAYHATPHAPHHASSDRETHPNPAAREQADWAWLADQ